MSVFCTECGKSGEVGQKVCIHCGTPFKKVVKETTIEAPVDQEATTEKPVVKETITEEPVEQVATTEQAVVKKTTREEPVEQAATTEQTVVKKPPMPKKQKVIIGAIAALLIIIIGFSVWANSYQSAESVEKRYIDAIKDKDASKLVGIITHEDGSKISEEEANAHVKYADDYGESVIKSLYTIEEKGKFLFLFKAYKIIVEDQYVVYDYMVDGLTFKLNGEEVEQADIADYENAYGPVIPGIYTLSAHYSSEDNALDLEEEMELNNGVNSIHMDIPISKVTVHLNGYESSNMSAYVLYNDEQYPLNDASESDEIGPVIIDGSQTAEVVVELPWGDVKSEPFSLDDSDVYANPTYSTDENFEDIVEMFTVFGDEYMQGMSENSNEDISVYTDELKEKTAKDFESDQQFSGKFISGKVDEESLSLSESNGELAMHVNAEFTFENARYTLGDEVELKEQVITREFTLVYNDGWLIDSIISNTWWGVSINEDAAVEITGSDTLYEPSKEAIKNASDKVLKEELTTFIEGYYNSLGYAYFNASYAEIEKIIVASSAAEKSMKGLVEKEDSSITDVSLEELSELDFEEVDKTTWKVTYVVELDVTENDESVKQHKEVVAQIKRVDEDLLIDEFLEEKDLE